MKPLPILVLQASEKALKASGMAGHSTHEAPAPSEGPDTDKSYGHVSGLRSYLSLHEVSSRGWAIATLWWVSGCLQSYTPFRGWCGVGWLYMQAKLFNWDYLLWYIFTRSSVRVL